jgi:hypothetical protein
MKENKRSAKIPPKNLVMKQIKKTVLPWTHTWKKTKHLQEERENK